MESYLPIPFRAGNKIIRRYVERQVDSNYNSSLVTLVDWKDAKGKVHERMTLFVKWVDPITVNWTVEFAEIYRSIYAEVCADSKASAAQLNARMGQRLLEEFGFSLPEKEFYVTVGIYPNLYSGNRLTPQGMYKWNYVHRDHIYSHLLYNMMFRPGRTFFIDNVCYNNGMGNHKGFLAALDYCKTVTARIIANPPSRDTAPYE